MSNYTKTTDFEAKDSLPSGDSGKIIRGSEFETEFDNISTAIATKADAANPTFTGTVTIDGLTVNGNTVLGNAATDTVTVTADIASNLIPSADDTYNLGASGAEWNDLYVDGVAYIDTINGFATTGNITFGDNDKAIFGNSSDLQIYHTGSPSSNSVIEDAGAGNLTLKSNGAGIHFRDGSDNLVLNVDLDSATTLYHNTSAKLATTSTGIDVTGVITTDGITTSADVNFGDNAKAIFGAGSDLQIYHNGSHSFITDTGTGSLYVRASDSLRIQTATNEEMIKADADGAVTLYNNNVAKLATTSTGIDVTGTVTADGLTVSGQSSLNDITTITSTNPRLRFIESDTTDVNTDIRNSGGDFQIGTINDAINSIKPRFNIDHATGDISFYEDTGTTAKFFWDASAESLGIGTSSPSEALEVTGNIQLSAGADRGIIGPDFRSLNIFANPNSSNEGIKFSTDGGTTTEVFIQDGGNVGIGTTSPARMLHLNGSVPIIRLEDSDLSGYAEISANAQGSGITFNADPTNSDANTLYSFNLDGTERMRIDSSGNLLVGTTSVSNSGKVTIDAGANASGLYAVTDASAGYAASVFERSASDGDITVFKKGGATVGMIQSRAGLVTNIILDPRTDGAGLTGTTNTISPVDETGTRVDNTINLASSAYRFKDLHLSGGAYLGGTAAANKLDDYEEGTWTPVVADANTGGNTATGTFSGRYTKVGNLVTVQAKLENINTTGMTSSNTLHITGLPFTSKGTNAGAIGGVQFRSITFSGFVTSFMGNSRTYMTFRESVSGLGGSNLAVSGIASGTGDIYFTFSYEAA